MSAARLLLAAAATAVLFGSAPTAALAQAHSKCPPNAVRELETKKCNNSKAVVERACCTNQKGKRRCKSFPKCPHVSPS